LLAENEQTLLRDWMESQKKSGALRSGRINRAKLTEASRCLLAALRDGTAAWQFRRHYRAPGGIKAAPCLDVSRSHATLGLTPSETVTFVFSLKEPPMPH
jgi:rsbT co-antagonist protein RsbR